MDTKKLRQKILDLAIRGKLVPQDPNDEPASVLLERIRAEKQQLIREGKIKAPRASRTSDTSHYRNDVPFEVPDGWVWTNLKNLCTFLSRGKSPKYTEFDRTYPVFAQKCNLKEGGISLEKALFLDPTTIDKWPESYRLKTGDVLVNSTGTGTVGRTRLFSESCLGDYPFVVPDSHVSVVRPFDEIDSAYLYAVISSQSMQTYIEDNLAGSTNQKELYIGVLENMAIPLPPVSEQHRIAAELERCFFIIDTIDSCQSKLESNLQTAKSKILSLAISGKLVPQDPTDEPAIDLLKRINPDFVACDKPHYKNLPEGWTKCKMSDVCSVTMGQSPDGGTVNHTDGMEFHQGKIAFGETFLTHSGIYTTEPAKIAEAHSVVLCVRAPVGIPNITERKICIGRGLCAICCSPAIDFKFVFYCIQTMRQYFEDRATGSTFKAISGDIVKNAVIPIPPIEEQHRIVVRVEEYFKLFKCIQDLPI